MAREICEVKSRNIVSSSTGFCYSDVTSGNSHLVNQIHGGCFASNPDMFNLTAGMEVIGFSKTPAESTTELYQHELTKSAEFTTGNLMVGTESTHWQDNNNRDGFFGSKAASLHHEGQFQLGCSKYLSPTRELLNEFCSLRTTQIDASKQNQTHKTKKWYDDDDDHNNGASSSRNQSLHSLDFMELQRRKTKLLSMLEEVDRRYRHYCVQMKAVVSSFEAVAGNGAASVYSALASKAMSRHFKCLRDGIVGQIEATRMAMGEKGPVAPGTTRGETPRLKIIDQSLRHQRCFQQMNAMENHPWRPQRGLPERSVSVLRAWLFEHFLHPYPNDVDKHILARQTGLSRSQVSNWFINARVRLWKPMVEEMYLEETKEHENNMAYSDGATDDGDDNVRGQSLHNPNILVADRKPTVDQLVRVDSECLSSIISNPDRNDAKSARILQNFGTYGAMELDFSSYSHHRHTSGGGASYGSDYNASNQTCFNVVGGGGVSLTLGLQQHGGTGVNLAFAPGSQSSLFYPRGDHIEDCQPVQYSVLDGEGQHLPYRNLMGAQLLHDFAG